MNVSIGRTVGARQHVSHTVIGYALMVCLAAGWTPAAHASGEGWGQDAPVVGVWAWKGFDGACPESFHYRIDGTLAAQSAQSSSVWQYQFSSEPDANGFYRLVETLATANGEPDCAGDTLSIPAATSGNAPAAPGVLRFVQLNPARDQLIMCKDASLKACFGPLRRQR